MPAVAENQPIALRWRLYRITPKGKVFLWGTTGRGHFNDSDMVTELRRRVPSLRGDVIGVERMTSTGIISTEFAAEVL